MTEIRMPNVSDKLYEYFPTSLIDEKNGMQYIPAEFIRDRVIEATDNNFDWIVQSIDYRLDGAVRDRTTRDGEILGQPTVCVCHGILTIPGHGSRSGIGTQTIEFGAGEDAAYKGAESDAFKRAAMAFGVALKQLYIDNHKFKNGNGRANGNTNTSRNTPQTFTRATESDVSSSQDSGHPAPAQWVPDASDRAVTEAPRERTNPNGPSPAQIRRFHAMRSQLGLSQDDASAELDNAYGVESAEELDWRQYKDFTAKWDERIKSKSGGR